MTNVQLDGDLIGSHLFNPMLGLNGFAVLSCYAEELRLSIPWTELEKKPTRIEVIGLYLICVPLLSTTAGIISGTGTVQDPRCTLRTRTKRSLLSRLERNFFGRRIEGEGPPKENHQTEETNESDVNHTSGDGRHDAKKNWKRKLVEKIFANLKASIHGIHLRCEVPEGGLETTYNANFPKDSSSPPERRAFSFGFTCDSFVMKTATSTWNSGTETFSGEQSKEKNYMQEENSSSKEVLSINESSWNPNTNSSHNVDSIGSRETQS
eukprot:CAMPEP_0194438532 /NCGR_PEP_ID=MMETSP0176-20130528/105495_1 /TAXON_ID=216777 /ORGANISM="Proboscia alata, Strain PI-D3" /LENGTH=265 /DNA_ID=CAMNT_0039260833 /DNA_START=61 /DNA_END=855 /DNA_ORIENTATION=-